MPRMSVVTTDFTYVRWLGGGRRSPGSSIRDRTRELGWWRSGESVMSQGSVYAFANNRYQGHAPATIQTFLTSSSACGPSADGTVRRLSSKCMSSGIMKPPMPVARNTMAATR